jgi:predicted ATPase/signal transduction histidine kinase
LYRARRSKDGATVVLKVLGERASAREHERLRNEHEMASAIDSASVLKCQELTTFQGRPALVQEAFGEATLEELLQRAGGKLPLADALDIGAQLAGALGDVHARGIVHRDVKPGSVLVQRAPLRVKLADLALATLVPSGPQAVGPVTLIEGSLPYMAPEQSGRMNRLVDQRADLYALGVTLYQMLTGRLPFEAADALGWIHCHIARSPTPPAAVDPAVPAAVSDIVERLLAKVAEERYQSARGLGHDLGHCLAQWRGAGRIDRFALGAHDVSDRLQIAQRLYGREPAVAALRAAFARVVDGGAPELMLVSGYSGVGKSSLVQELGKPVVAARGFFLAGKFLELGRGVPYSTIVQALAGFAQEILAGSEAGLASWRQRLGAALGAHGRLITNLVPPLELVLGAQPPVPALPPAEAQARFYAVVRAFLSAVARPEHPLALFLDDLQWADPASLDLLVHVLGHPDTRHLLVIGAYRDNEVSPGHPLMLALERARAAGVTMGSLVLQPLGEADLAQLLADTLRAGAAEVAPLAALVHGKTGGNPFFANQFLKTLTEEGLLRLDPRAGRWRWDVEGIRAKGFTDNVLALMLGKLGRLPTAARETLQLAACVGNEVDSAILTTIRQRAPEEIHRDLSDAVRQGLMVRQGAAYRFLHDRVQQAAYSLIPEDRRAAVHLRIGRLLLAATDEASLPARVFNIVGHFNRALPLLEDQDGRDRIAELDLLAGRRAKAAAAYGAAIGYYAAALELLGGAGWERRRPQAWEARLERAECEYLTGNFAAAETLLGELEKGAAHRLESARVCLLWISLHTTRGQNLAALEKGGRCLALFGLALPLEPTAAAIDEVFAQVWRELGDRRIEELLGLPLLTDPDALAAVEVLWAMSPAAFFTSREIDFVVQCHLATLSIRHGNSGPGCRGYSGLGMHLGRSYQRYAEGSRFAALACELIDRHGFVAARSSSLIVRGGNVDPWTQPLARCAPHLEQALEASLALGSLNRACYACGQLGGLRFAQGLPLPQLEAVLDRYVDLARRARYADMAELLADLRRLVSKLRGGRRAAGEPFDEAAYEAALVHRGFSTRAARYWALKLLDHLLADNPEEALAAADRARALEWAMTGMPDLAEAVFHRALAAAAAHDRAAPARQAELVEALAGDEAQLAAWAAQCRETFLPRQALVDAELARVRGQAERAMSLYESAVCAAREGGFVQIEALAHERAAAFYTGRGLPRIAETYAREARAAYERWGAAGKVAALDRVHPPLAPAAPVPATTTVAVQASAVDLLSVVKASETIARETLLPSLRDTLMRVVIEQAGAQRGWLLQPEGGEFSVQSEVPGPPEGARPAPRPARPDELPLSIVQYAARTLAPVIIDDWSRERRFSDDEALVRRRPRSVLCLPIVHKGELAAIVHLENELAAGAFSRDKLAVLGLVSGQAAISLENSKLFESLIAEAAERRRAEKALQFLADAGALLSESLDHAATLDRLTHLLVPFLADWCILDLLEEGQIRRLAAAHADPARLPILAEIQKRFPPRWESPHPAARAIRTGAPQLVPEVTDERLAELCDGEEHVRLVRALGTRTGLCVPLLGRDRVLGAITLGAGRREPYGPAQLELVVEIARRASIAIDNAQLYRQARNAVRLRDEFLSVASHELNTPMAAMMLNLQELAAYAEDAEPMDPALLARMAASAERQGTRLTRLIAELLDVTRIEAGVLALRPERVELCALVKGVAERLDRELARARCPLGLSLRGPIVGRWDPLRLEQVVSNLLANALKFGAGAPIEIVAELVGRVARLSVRDHGIGIDAEKQPLIFDRFVRAVSASEYGGLGLGLYISRQIVQSLGGSIQVDSKPGEGATFTVLLVGAARGDEADQGGAGAAR